MEKEQKNEWKEGGWFVMEKRFDDGGQIKTVYEFIEFINRDEKLTYFKKLNGEEDFLLNCDVRIRDLWFSEDFYFKLGLKHMQDLIKSNSYNIDITINEMFDVLGNSFDKIEFLKSLNIEIQFNPINHQPKYMWSK